MSPKYRVTVEPKSGKAYNPIHDELQGAIAADLEFHVGLRGVFHAEMSNGRMTYVSTSPIMSVEESTTGDVRVTTLNTVYTFGLLV